MSNFIVYVEQQDGSQAGLEALGAVNAAGATATAILSGAGAADAAGKLAQAGVTNAICMDGAGSESPDALAKAIADIVSGQSAKGFLAAATSKGRDLAPRVAAHLDAVLFSDITGLEAAGDSFQVTRPWLAGKAIATLTSSASALCATTRLNVFPTAEGSAPAVETQTLAEAGKIRVVGLEAKAKAKLDVMEAPVVVSGGRGLKEAENFAILEGLADAFGDAAVGASRAVVDAGWRPHSEQVGQTGKTVSPKLYFAVGISGAIQHLAGMKTSGTIVAINKDADAPIFKVADYGIVGDALEIVPQITEAVAKIKAQ
ncbi:MAG: electron transfer flavoprotein subunit alpha/FixB family protein, partial [Planctomycetota bacterium]|nr:electron transfer flavoprotein subunit alpha/FixB family protein [Planctomycetota bacterium]